MSYYSILLLYPDSIAHSYGTDTYYASCRAKSVEEAIAKVREEACQENNDDDPDSWAVLLCLKGDHNDITPEAYRC